MAERTQGNGGGAASHPPAAPHAFAAEQALLGALVVNNDLWTDVDGKISPDDFYDIRHKTLFGAISELASKQHVDPVLLLETLKQSGRLDGAGGEDYVTDLASIGAAPANAPAYAAAVADAAKMRKMLDVINSANARILSPDGSSAEKIIDETESMLSEIGKNDSRSGPQAARDEARTFLNQFIEIADTGDFDSLLGVMSGFTSLDKKTTGLHGGDLVIIAGRPGAGKTAFALNVVRHVSVKTGVVVFSLEMSAKQLIMRLISHCRIDMQKLRTGRNYRGEPITHKDLRDLTAAVGELEDRDIFIDDSGFLNILELKSRARRVARNLARNKKNLGLIVIDYLQLLSATPNERSDSRALEVAAISRGLKALAKELDVPVVAMSQLNRSAKMRQEQEPELSDLRESGSIEQDADIVLFLHEEREKGAPPPYPPPPEGSDIKLIIGKQRNGPLGRIDLKFIKQYSRFMEAAPEDGPGAPPSPPPDEPKPF